jgi:hypothetical protein
MKTDMMNISTSVNLQIKYKYPFVGAKSEMANPAGPRDVKSDVLMTAPKCIEIFPFSQ